MPWEKVDTVDLRREFVALAEHGDFPFSKLCQRYGISRKTGYKWLKRFKKLGGKGLEDCSKKPLGSPGKTPPKIEAVIVAARDQFPAWGGRKIKRYLEKREQFAIPSASTITEILKRHGRLDAQTTQTNFIRFEHKAPNHLWQMDFKGDVPLSRGRCYPLTLLDDHSRFSLCIDACNNQQQRTVQQRLIEVFRRYGKPQRMTMDNGSPWGAGVPSAYTQLTVWLIENGISVSHSAPYHPQTQGKLERFHRSFKAELLGRRQWDYLSTCQTAFDAWRELYNTQRPHEALDLDVPSSRYLPSSVVYEDQIPPYEYGPNDDVRKVGRNLFISYKRYEIFLGQAFLGKQVGIRPTTQDGKFEVYFCHQKVNTFDLNQMAKRR